MDVMDEEMDEIFKYLSKDETRQLNLLLDKIRKIEAIPEDKSDETPITG